MSSETVQRLRQQLREKFPAAHREEKGPCRPVPIPRGEASQISTDHCSLSTWHFPPGALTEISPAHPACGLTLLIAALLSDNPQSAIRDPQSPLVLIDARDRFDPASFSPDDCARLLWLRCRETQQALKAADLLLRDGNLPFVLLDLSALPARELRRIPSSSWHRLRQLAETSRCTLLALTPVPLIPRAALRLTLTREFTLHHLDHSLSELLPEVRTETTRRHVLSA